MTPVRIIVRVLAVVIVPPAAWWWLDRSPAISVDGYEVATPNVPRGGSLKIRYHVNFLRRCSGDGNRLFKDAAGVSIPAESYKFRDGIGRNGEPVPLDNPQWVSVESIVPVTATPGKAQYQNVSDFFCNPLQRFLQRGVDFTYPLIRFNVSDSPPVEAKASVTLFRPVERDVDVHERASVTPAAKEIG